MKKSNDRSEPTQLYLIKVVLRFMVEKSGVIILHRWSYNKIEKEWKGELKKPIFHISDFQITQWFLEESLPLNSKISLFERMKNIVKRWIKLLYDKAHTRALSTDIDKKIIRFAEAVSEWFKCSNVSYIQSLYIFNNFCKFKV